MQKNALFAFVAACLLLVIGCTKTDMLSDELTLKNNSVPGMRNAISTSCDVISFSNLADGALISSVTSDGGLVVAMTSWNSRSPSQPIASMVFDSKKPELRGSKDLGTPNEKFETFPGSGIMGPGKGIAGESGAYVNSVALGNIMCIKNFDYPSQVVEDDAVSWIAYNFGAQKVTMQSITVLDVEANEFEDASVLMYDTEGGTLLNSVTLPHMGQNGKGIISLGDTKGVGYMKVNLNGSMAMDDLRFCIDVPPPPPPGVCTRTQGYWKTHGPVPTGNNSYVWPEAVKSGGLTLGTVPYSAAQLLSIFNAQPKQGNGLVSLAHQLIAAKLNIAKGADGSAISATIASADALIGSRVIPPVGSGFLSSAATASLNNLLTQFNEGTLPNGPDHCDN